MNIEIEKIITAVKEDFDIYTNSPRDYTVTKVEDNWIEVQMLDGPACKYQIFDNNDGTCEIHYAIDDYDSGVIKFKADDNINHTIVIQILGNLLQKTDLPDEETDYDDDEFYNYDDDEASDKPRGRHAQFIEDCFNRVFV